MKNTSLILISIHLGGFTLHAQTFNVKQNVVFILVDDMGWKDLGCYGNRFIETPHIDSLANSGIRFTQAYSSSPVSSPSRASILTGKHSAPMKLTNYLIGNNIDDKSPILPALWQPFLATKEITMPEILKKEGYRTGMVGKWHLGSDNTQAPWGQGFDYTRMIGRNGLDYYNYSIFIDSYQNEFKDDGSEYLTDKLTEYGMDFIQKNKEQPFFLYLAYSAPHIMLVPKAGSESKYLRKYQNRKPNVGNPYYAAMIESLDDGVGQILKTLRENNLLENTIIVFTSDNGGVVVDELGPTPTSILPLRGGKGHVYEGGIRVPAIISCKSKIPAHITSDYYFSNIDYLPTITQFIGLNTISDSLDSKSILSAILYPDKMTVQSDTLFWHYPHFSNQGGRPASAVRCGNYKLILKYETNTVELFDIVNDSSEIHDLSKKRINKTKSLLQMLENWKIKNHIANPPQNPNYKKNMHSTQLKNNITEHEQN